MRPHEDVQAAIARIVELLKTRYRPEQIVLFGSWAHGTPTADSDIDLLIVKETQQPFFQRLAEVRRLVSQSRRGHPFEPIVVTPAELEQRLARGDQFFEQIVANGRVLYAHR